MNRERIRNRIVASPCQSAEADDQTERYETIRNDMKRNDTDRNEFNQSGDPMPRQGITAEQITSAIEALNAKGESVTQLSIRKELGNTGSLGTISSFLRTLRQNIADPGPQAVPAAIPESIQASFGKAWSLAMATAQAELAPQRVALDQETAAIRALLTQTQAENDEAIRVLDLQMDLLTNQLVEANAREQVAQSRVAELSDALGYHRARLEALTAEYHNELARKDAVIAGHEKQLAELVCKVTSPTLTD